MNKETPKVVPEKKPPLLGVGEASDFPRVSKVVQESRQQPELGTATKESKRKKCDVADPESAETVPKKKKASVTPGKAKLFSTSLDKFLDVTRDKKKRNNHFSIVC